MTGNYEKYGESTIKAVRFKVMPEADEILKED